MTNNIDNTQRLIDYSVEFAKRMLTENQEFFPFAVTLNIHGDLIPATFFDGDDQPLSEDLLNNLQFLVDNKLSKREVIAYALTYDVLVKKNDHSKKNDVITVKIKHTDIEESKLYYFTYRLLKQKGIEFIDSWSEPTI